MKTEWLSSIRMVWQLLFRTESWKSWFGMTPEERTLRQTEADVAIVDGGVAVSVTVTEDPVQTKTTVSEICLPSFSAWTDTH